MSDIEVFNYLLTETLNTDLGVNDRINVGGESYDLIFKGTAFLTFFDSRGKGISIPTKSTMALPSYAVKLNREVLK